jgi:ornithine cyclodeaminase
MLILTHDDVEKLLPMPQAIDVMAEAMTALAKGEVVQPLRTLLNPENAAGLMLTMPAYMAAAGKRPYYSVKIISVFHGNTAKGLDAHQGAVLLVSGETGQPLAVMNASAITAIRTAAVSGMATRLLARAEASVLAIFGAGVQARSHLAAMAAVRPLREVRVVSRTPASADTFVAEQSPLYNFPIVAVADGKTAVSGADIIVTATNASQPVLKYEWLSPGTHINAIGAYQPTTREIDSPTVAAAQLFVDRRESAEAEAGDYLIPLREGVITASHIQAELGDLLLGRHPGRTTPQAITLFKSLGLPVQDLAAAVYLYHQARQTNTGTDIPF